MTTSTMFKIRLSVKRDDQNLYYVDFLFSQKLLRMFNQSEPSVSYSFRLFLECRWRQNSSSSTQVDGLQSRLLVLNSYEVTRVHLDRYLRLDGQTREYKDKSCVCPPLSLHLWDRSVYFLEAKISLSLDLSLDRGSECVTR